MKTNLLSTDTREKYREAVRAAARVLESGGIVGLPTETVYGLAASAEHPSTVERLKSIKGRPDEKKFTICLALEGDVRRFASEVPRTAEKLMSRFWPGPLTVVLPAGETTVGLRLPGLALTRDVLLEADTTVVMPSANPAGAEPATTAGEVARYFDGQIELIVDAGASPLGTASTVVEVAGTGELKILREGAVSAADVRLAAAKTILFVCTGNLCRSPMAEGIAKDLLAKRLRIDQDRLEESGYRVVSAGTGAFGGSPPSPEAVAVMREAGMDISGYLSRPLSLELVREADIIYGMAPNHVEAVAAIDTAAGARGRLLSPEGAVIEDPIGQSITVYRRVRDRLIDAIGKRLKEWTDEDSGR